MRPSKRTAILDAALEVVEDGGVTALSYEPVAEAAGLTKGGIQYHFPTREALLLALQEHLVDHLEESLVSALGKPLDSASADEKLAAYALIGTAPGLRAEVLLALETATDPELHAPWEDAYGRWGLAVPAGDLTPAQIAQITIRLAADGLWVHDHLTSVPLAPEVRRQIAEHLATSAIRAESLH